jgi:hypothetical protein
MPGEVIDRPNPQAPPSNIPDTVNELAVKLEKIDISEDDLRGLEEFRRASNYIAAGEFPATKKPSSISNGTSYDLPCRQCYDGKRSHFRRYQAKVYLSPRSVT